MPGGMLNFKEDPELHELNSADRKVGQTTWGEVGENIQSSVTYTRAAGYLPASDQIGGPISVNAE